MNKIYKVKKNAAGHSVACSEFAKGHTKKAVLGSLLIVGILGMATTVSAQVTNDKGPNAYIGINNNSKATGRYSVVGGGFFNEATSDYSTIVGGSANEAKGEYSTIVGGNGNKATGRYSIVGGGSANEAKGDYSTIGGGDDNEAKGENSTVAGGRKNQANGAGSFAAGVENQANANNAVALGNKNIINGAENSVAIGSNNTIDGGKKNVFILGSDTDAQNAQNGSVLLGHETSGKAATVVKDATVGDLSLEGFAGSKANSGTVSVGSKDKERQIVNVGAGRISNDSTDAVNGSQLHALAKVVDTDFKNLTENQNYLIKQDEAINRELEGLADYANAQDEKILKNQTDITANKTAIEQNFNRTFTNGFEIEKNKAGIAKNQADIQTLENNVEEELLKLSGRLIDQKADIDNNINNIYELAQQQDQHSSDIKTLKKNVEEGLLELSGHLIDQKADIAQNQTDIQDLATYNELQDQYAQKQTEAIDALNKASSENTQNIEDLAAYNELQDAYAKQQTEAIDALNKASSENTQNIAKNQADIANNIKNIYELAQQQDQHSSDIKTLAKASAANTDRIAKNKADADASFETLTKNQNTLIEKDKEHDKLITANKTAIDANKASADTKFAATADAITKNGNAITKNAKSITDLGTKVDGFDSRVTALDTKVNAFDGRITALDSKVENGMAAQAALSGLFQPYSVGKFNATAALGGYGSKSAVAIGAGYRVNPNLAFKAGAAINTSGNKKGSYNIGVNYEF
ncbi:YadA-like family protein [Moraxella catarrhalis]|uniref:YadA-like family protein n=1 Tax=Moraxella catarrhalis TaxID=480 RepID=UPI00128DE257|nr:YadA-like family protein [Moraxella catarrhalis]MPX20500.1 cell surface protein [Moraxella catarrhalis]